MNYIIRSIKDNEVVATEYADEHPTEDYLRLVAARSGSDFCDVCRKEGE